MSTQIQSFRKQTLKVGIQILNTISEFKKVKNSTQKGPLKIKKDKKSKSYRKQNSPKVGILILNNFSKFSKSQKNKSKTPLQNFQKPIYGFF